MPNKDAEKRRAYNRGYYLEHKETGRARRRIYEAGRREERRAHDRAYRLSHKEKIIDYRKSHVESIRKNAKVYRESHRDQIQAHNKKAWLLRKYGLTLENFHALLARQGGGCAICKTSDWRGKNNRPMIDHDHSSGQIRGILCHRCNIVLGHIGDNPKLAIALAHYLQSPSYKRLFFGCATELQGNKPSEAV